MKGQWKEKATEMQGDGLLMGLRSNHYFLAEEKGVIWGAGQKLCVIVLDQIR